MSREALVANRYAKALFDLAQDKGIALEVEGQLKVVVEGIQSSKELETLLKHPGIEVSAKHEILKQIFGGVVSEIVMNTLELLIIRGRESVLPELYDSYVAIAGEALGQANATVYSPEALSAEQIQQIVAQFSKLIGKKIRIENVISPNLLGGIQVRIGDRLYDGSLSGKLERLEKSLKQAQAL